MTRASNPLQEPVIGLTWSTDAADRCVSSVERAAGLLPPMAGIALPAWVAALRAPEAAVAALEIGAALRQRQPFDRELEID